MQKPFLSGALFTLIASCTTMMLNGMTNNENVQAVSQETKQLINSIKKFNTLVSLSDRYLWAEEIVAYKKSLFCTDTVQKYYALVQNQINALNKDITKAQTGITKELRKSRNTRPFAFGTIAVLCGVAQWLYRPNLSDNTVYGLFFLSGFSTAGSGIFLYENHKIVQKLRTSQKRLIEAQSKLGNWLNEEIDISAEEYAASDSGSEEEE